MDSRPTRHLHGAELAWFDFDPYRFVTLAARFAEDNPGLADLLGKCRRAAWKCDAYLAFHDQEETAPGGRHSVVLWEDGGEDFVVDLDGDGNPVGVEFLSRLPCRSK